MEDQVVIMSFDFFMLYELEKEYPGLDSGFQYDEKMAKGLQHSNEWFEKVPEARPDQEVFEKNKDNFAHFVMEANVVGKLVSSTCAKFEYTVLDDDSIRKFKEKSYAVGIYTIFPRIVQMPKKLDDEEMESVITQLVNRKVDWLVTDDVIMLLSYFQKRSIPSVSLG